MDICLKNMADSYGFTKEYLDNFLVCPDWKKRHAIKKALKKYLIEDSDMLENNIMFEFNETKYNIEITQTYKGPDNLQFVETTYTATKNMPAFADFLVGVYSETLPHLNFNDISLSFLETDIFNPENKGEKLFVLKTPLLLNSLFFSPILNISEAKQTNRFLYAFIDNQKTPLNFGTISLPNISDSGKCYMVNGNLLPLTKWFW